jgi:hypothetical protein
VPPRPLKAARGRGPRKEQAFHERSNATGTTDANDVVRITLSPQEAAYAASFIVEEIAALIDRNRRSRVADGDMEVREAVGYLLPDLRMHVDALGEVALGDPSGPVAVEWQRVFVERLAKWLTVAGADAMTGVEFDDTDAIDQYRESMRMSQAGAAILGRLEAAR